VSKLIMMCYLIGGHHVGDIADEMSTNRAAVRGVLREWGITLKPTTNGYALGRDPVCHAIRRAKYGSFHGFVKVKGLAPITEQASGLGVSEKSLTRVYNAYKRLLAELKSAGVVLPTSQFTGVELEHRTREGRGS